MKNSRNKTMAAVIALFLALTIAVTLVALPTANAHTPPWTLQTWAYLAVAPNPVGVGQNVFVNMWVDKPMEEASVFNNIRRHNYQLTITRPDGTNETHKFDLSDTTGVQFYIFTPDQVGVYSMVFYYPGEVYTWNDTAAQRVFTNDTFLPATSKTVKLTVQQEPLPAAITSYPLPSEYWTRPIEGQNTDWWSISSNYLRGAQIKDGAVQPDGLAPNSPHIMWTKPLQFGGVVGGTNTGVNGMTYYTGLSYEIKFTNSLIINGRLYYAVPESDSPSGGGYVCVDLRTGEQYWWQNYTVIPSFGQLEWFDSENQHGVVPNGYLWTTPGFGTNRTIYDPIDGSWLFTITDVPSGTMEYGSKGEILIYVLNVANKWLALWNFTACFPVTVAMNAYRPVGRVINGSIGYSWNVTLSAAVPTGSSIRYTKADETLLFSNIVASYTGRYGTNDPYAVGVISLKPASRGQVSWMKNYTAPQPQANTIGITRVWLTVDPVNHVFILRDKEILVNYGYSFDDGSLLWSSTPIATAPDWEYFSTSGFTAYGKFYYCGYGGILYCYDTKNGTLLWTYGNGGEGNSTNAGLQTPWGMRDIDVGTIADGKVYLFTSEHSPNQPLYKNTYVRCIDAYTGKEIWKILSWANPGSFQSPGIATADGYMAYLNIYDMQVYCLGKGPSATTVQAPLTAITAGNTAVIQGTVTDIAAGTKQDEQAARFPNGVPAVSDDCMGAWMEYVYMQKPYPTNATGVQVSIDAIDPNGNYVHIATATSETTGLFHYAWTPPNIPGAYTITATFGGSESYWPSYAQTAMYVSETPPSPTPTPAAVLPPDTTMTIIGTGIAIIIAVAIATILLLRRRP